MKTKKFSLLFAGIMILALSFGSPLIQAAEDFDEMTVVDNEECTIRITGIDPDNMWGYTLEVFLENKSADKTYRFSVNDGIVNGISSDPLFSTEVAPGKKANSEINFMSMPDVVDEVTDIELSFRVYDSDDWSADDVADETVHVYPLGEENARRYEREVQGTDIVLADTDEVTMIVTGFEEDEIWGYTMNVYLDNRTEDTVMFSIDDASVNGYMLDPFWSKSVSAGTCAFSSVSWYDSDLEENNIGEVSEIEFTLRVYNYDDWMADDLFNQSVTVLP